jgi:hypothetical protein
MEIGSLIDHSGTQIPCFNVVGSNVPQPAPRRVDYPIQNLFLYGSAPERDFQLVVEALRGISTCLLLLSVDIHMRLTKDSDLDLPLQLTKELGNRNKSLPENLRGSRNFR